MVLAGDATMDPRDYAGLGNADFVPTKQAPMNGVALETASDDWFVDFRDNGLPEVAIGRLLGARRGAGERRGGENHRLRAGRPPRPGRRTCCFADQNSDTGNFEQASNNLRTAVPSDYRVHTDFLGALGDGPAHQALTDAVNNGQLIVNYWGTARRRFGAAMAQLLTQ